MKRIAVLVLVVMTASVAIARHSAALGDESLACLVSDGTPGTLNPLACAPRAPRESYDVLFQVQGGSGTDSHAWALSGGTVVSGCTSTSSTCIVRVVSRAFDKRVGAVVILAGTIKLEAVANIPAVCAAGGQLSFC